MMYSIHFGSKEIKFHLEYSERKSLGITITPDLAVIVRAPEGTSLERVKDKVRKRAPWIIRQESFFLSFHPKTPARKYVGGESHLYLGRQHILKVRKGKKDQVTRKRNTIEVVTTDKKKVKKLMLQWYRMNAKIKFAEIGEPIIQQFKTKLKKEPSGIFMQNMPTRWGSCTTNGKIILNPELIKAPKGCIEYVMVHELCHLVHRGHTQKFFDLQSKMMPDWEKWKLKLEKLLA